MGQCAGKLIYVLFIGSGLQKHCGNTFWLGIGAKESKVGWMDKLGVSFFLKVGLGEHKGVLMNLKNKGVY
jgi:hypothetical protein